MKKWTAVGLLGLTIVTGTMAWRTAVERFGRKGASWHLLVAQGTAPVPPSPWSQGTAPVPPSPWSQGTAPVPPSPWSQGTAPVPPSPWQR